MYFILASHGEYAKACRDSCEMITGAAPQFHVVTFTEDMTKETVEKLYRAILEENGEEQCGAVITDILGGTPYNAAIPVIYDHTQILLISGLCLSMLIALSTGDSLENAVKLARETICCSTNERRTQMKEKERGKVPNGATVENGIVNVRLDERLIHGQVAAYWVRTLQADRIMIVGDDIVRDEIGKSALIAAVPQDVKLSILTVENAAKRLNNGVYAGQRVFLIVKEPDTIMKLLKSDVSLKEVIIGNMGQKEGRKQVKKSVFCTSEELQTIASIEAYGVPVYAQMIPSDEKKPFLMERKN